MRLSSSHRYVWTSAASIPSKKDGDIIGNRVRVKIVKNKVAPPFRQAEFDIMYGTGISKEGSVLDMAVDFGIVQKSGAWYTYGEERLGQGHEAAKGFLATNPNLMEELEHSVRVACGLELDDERVGLPITPDDEATSSLPSQE